MKPSLKIENRKIADLIPYARNARVHSDNHVAQIAKSITEFGWTNPILVDGTNGIIAGHGRIKAAQLLKMTEVPVLELKNLSEAQRRAYILADNKLALNSDWDGELLKLELHALDEMKYDLELVGFDGAELSTIMFAEEIDPNDKAEKPVNFVVQYNIIFDDEQQQDTFYGFIRYLKENDNESETVGQRLIKFIEDNGYGAT